MEINSEDLRTSFKECGLSYDDITEDNFKRLIDILKDVLTEYPHNNELEMKVCQPLKKDIKFKGGKLVEGYIKVDGSYFKGREAISFNKNGFIGFAGWASSDTIQPILDSFNRWKSYLKDELVKREYNKIKKEDGGKTLYDVLPPFFSENKKGFIVKPTISKIKNITKLLNECSDYFNKTFTEVDVARYLLLSLKDNWELAFEFIPYIDDNHIIPIMDYYVSNGEDIKEFLKLNIEEREKKNDEICEYYNIPQDKLKTLKWEIKSLEELGQSYRLRMDVKNNVIDKSDWGEGSYPRLGRGSICRYYIPVKGLTDKESGELFLVNPRSKKNETFKIKSQIENISAYVCCNSKGNEVYLIEHGEVVVAYDTLFPINKEIYAGWWNRTLIKKS